MRRIHRVTMLVAVDAQNVLSCIGKIDYGDLGDAIVSYARKYFCDEGGTVEGIYKYAYQSDTSGDRSAFRAAIAKHGWETRVRVINSPIKVDIQSPVGGDADVLMAVNTMVNIYRVQPTHLVLVTGDGDFGDLVMEAKRMGISTFLVHPGKKFVHPALASMVDDHASLPVLTRTELGR